MKKEILFIFLFSISSFAQALKEDEFFIIFEKYYYPEQVYIDIDEEKELASHMLKELNKNFFTFEKVKVFSLKEKKGVVIPKDSAFYSRVCYLQYLISPDFSEGSGAIIRISEKKEKYKIIPDNTWNYYKKTSGLGYPYYLNCYFDIHNLKEINFEKNSLLKFKKKKDFCNKDFCYKAIFYFYLTYDKGDKEFSKKIDKIIFEVLNIKEKAPFSNKRIWEIYGKILE